MIMHDDVGWLVRREWYSSPSIRTILYYSYLLTKETKEDAKSNKDIRSELEDMVSIQENTFPNLTMHLQNGGVFIYGDLLLSASAFNTMTEILDRDMAISLDEGDKIPFNGLALHRITNNDDRVHEWVEKGCEYVKNTFIYPGITVTSKDIGRDTGKVLILTSTDYSIPPILWYFTASRKIKKATDIAVLREIAEAVSTERKRAIYNSIPPHTDVLIGTSTINIVAACAYSSGVAAGIYNAQSKTRLVGPVNLPIIGAYFQKNSTNQVKNYKNFCRLLNPVNGVLQGGILFAKWVTDYLEDNK